MADGESTAMVRGASELPSTQVISDAPLPERYEAAKRAVAECHRVDECKEWSDRAVALASYARQVRDHELVTWRSGSTGGRFGGVGSCFGRLMAEGNTGSQKLTATVLQTRHPVRS